MDRRTLRYSLKEIVSFPDVYEFGVLYWSKEFEMSAHLCACGCGDIIQVPVDLMNFSIVDGSMGPTVRPSIGNWGVCDAHYYITNGEVEWLGTLSKEQIIESRSFEDSRREAYYSNVQSSAFMKLKAAISSFMRWLGF